MKVTALETYLLSAPLPQPVRTSTHTIARVSEVVVKLTTDAGLVGHRRGARAVPVPGRARRPAQR